MTATPNVSRGSRVVRWTIRAALRIAAAVGITIGFVLIFLPIGDVLAPEQALMYQKSISTLGGSPVVVGLGLGLLLFGAWIRRRVIRLRQRDNDDIAQRILSELRAHPQATVPKFYLYLRAFETTGRLHVPLYLRLRKLSTGLTQLVTNDVESYVSNAVRGVAPLIALGRPGESVGAGRVVTDDASWNADVVTLMKRAKAILLVPSSRPGTMWEMETLKREGLLTKVVFIMPPRSKGTLDTRERWEAARQALATHGLDAPEHQERGLLFEVGPDGKVCNVEPMLLNSARQVRKSLARILSDDPPKGGLYHAIGLADNRMARATGLGWVETMRQLLAYPIAAVALLVGHPAVGFNPAESWSTVMDRTTTAHSMTLSDENAILATSPKYLALEAKVSEEGLAEWREQLRSRGYSRLKDDDLRKYYLAWGDMMARVPPKTCAAIVRGNIQPEEMNIALTYIPSARIDNFLRARAYAIVAEAEKTPRPVSEKALEEGTRQFLASLDTEDRQRFKRIDASSLEALSDDDRCWLLRTMYGGVARLPERQGNLWARNLAAMESEGDDSTTASAAPVHPAKSEP